jgi:hypothetical protein
VAATDPLINQACVILSNGTVSVGPVAVKGQCRTGTSVCSNGAVACPGYVGPSAELCDNLDQDCDGFASNGVAITDPRVGQACGTSLGECDPGHLVCNSSNSLVCDALPPGTETCNSKDDDCDGLVDEHLPASPTVCGNAAKGLCKPGLEACISGQIVCAGEITPTPEICDGLAALIPVSVSPAPRSAAPACSAAWVRRRLASRLATARTTTATV